MQKIFRIYIGNCGYPTAWYDGVTFDLTDPDSLLPSDTVINLENGGGKTTLLSLIFSCFETSQDRFLKHIQNKNNHFSQYFSPDGLPGVVMVEWLMPARTVGGYAYRLVVGQAVSVKATSEPPETERLFFSFEEHDDLKFTDVPGPKLGGASAGSMADFSRWAHDQQKKYPGDVYITRKQADWHKHLNDERLIDLDMLRMQVNFSAQEGGFDTGFLNFHTELEFLRKFFHLTLDAQRASAVRDNVTTTCDNLRRKPQYVRRLAELTKFQSALQLFGTAAGEFRQTEADHGEVRVQGARVAVALQARALQYRESQAREARYESEQRAIASTGLADSAAHNRDVVTLTSLWHGRRIAGATIAKDAAMQALKTAAEAILHVKAARLTQEIESLKTRIKELEATAGLAQEGLQPFRMQVEMQGALLRRSLFDAEQALRDELKTLDSQEKLRTEQVGKQGAELQAAENDGVRATREQAQLDAKERTFTGRRSKLVADAVLLSENESTQDALARWQQTEAGLLSEKIDLLAQYNHLQTQAKDCQDAATREGKEAVRLDAEFRAENVFIADGQAERERLSQLSALSSAAEADVVDPESPVLVPTLERVIVASAGEVSLCDVRLAELNATKQSIDETGVAGHSPDVALVVQCLRKADIRSARPFNEYISQALQSAQKARDLVMSDPARFLGVCVAEAEMDKARKVTWGERRPSKPVLVSPTALDPQSASSAVLVVPPDNDAAYNVDAAQTLQTTLHVKIADEQNRRDSFYARQAGTMQALEQLQAFLKRFGDGKLAVASLKASQFAQDRDIAKARSEDLSKAADGARQKAIERQKAAQERNDRARDAAASAKTLEEFFAELESDRPSRLERLQELVQLLEDAQGRKLAANDAIEELGRQTQMDFQKKVVKGSEADQLGQERGRIEYYDKELRADALLKANPVDISTLRMTYADAASTFKTEEKDRLGLLQEKLQNARNLRVAKVDEFTRDFRGVTLSQIKPYEGRNHTAMLPELELEEKRAQDDVTVKGSELLVANKESTAWHTSNKGIARATPEMELLDEAALVSRKSQAEELTQAALNRMRNATEEADRAKGNATQFGNSANADDNLANLVKAALALGDKPDPELLVLELAGLTGTEPAAGLVTPMVLAADANEHANQLIAEFTKKVSGRDKARSRAQGAFDKVKSACADNELRQVEPELASQMLANDFTAACVDAPRLLEGLADRIGTTQSSLDHMQVDFDACAEEVMVISRAAISLLTSATNKRVPVGAPYVGGKAILKMRSNVTAIPLDARRQALHNFLDGLIDTNVIPATGADLVADAVLRMQGGKALGLQLLKMVPEEEHQYVTMDKITNSGGEGVVMAMFLYGVISQLRAERQAKLQKGGGGPLILDNPFAKATTPALWQAQRMLAASMGVQLVFATALQDYNALGEFPSFIRLRRGGKNSKTNRTHLETVRFKFNEQSTVVT